MKHTRVLVFILLSFWSFGFLYSLEQDSTVLIKKLNQASNTQQKIEAHIKLAKYFLAVNVDRAMSYAQQAKDLAQTTKDVNALADAICAEGEANFLLNNYEASKQNFTEALSLYDKKTNPIGLGEAYEGLGKNAYRLNEHDAALAHFSDALKIFELQKYKDGLAGLYINLALLYEDSGNNNQAIDFYEKALKIAKENKDIVSEASCYTNLGTLYSGLEKTDLAIEYLQKSLELKKSIGNKKGEATSLNNLGAIYYGLGDMNKALQYFQQAYDIYLAIDDKKSSFPSCNNIGSIYHETKQYDKALEYFNRAYGIAKELNSLSKKIVSVENLSMLHRDMGDYKQAADYGILCFQLKDTLYNKEQAEINAEMQTKFASEKKQQENEILNLQVKSESFMKTIFIIIAAFFLVVAFFIFRGLRQKQKINLALEEKNKIIEEQKQTVEHQKHIVEEQNKDITDSIRYAERIQQAILPPDKIWNELLPQSFVFYQPKDILSGDFYWIEQKGDLVFVAAADCTGHGVPGALISIVNYNLLNKAVLEKDLNDPADILNYVNHQLTVSLHQTYQESSIRDGMDISLCVINTKTLAMNFAGANNPIYVISNGELTQYNADKFPVGAFIDEQIQSFNSSKIQLQKNDLIYLFSDGYADQFGGPKGKKFKYQQLKLSLIQNHQKPMVEQRENLKSQFISWKGKLEQIDDVLVIGIRV